MHGRSVAVCSVLFLACAFPGWSASPGPVPQHDPAYECDQALIAAQDMQAMVGTGIAAFVEQVPITSFELRQRILWHVALARDVDMTARARIKDHVLQELRRNVLDRIAAQRADVTVAQADVDAQIEDFMSYQGLTRHELQMSLERAGVQMATLRSVVAEGILRARLNRTVPGRFEVPPWNCLRAQ